MGNIWKRAYVRENHAPEGYSEGKSRPPHNALDAEQREHQPHRSQRPQHERDTDANSIDDLACVGIAHKWRGAVRDGQQLLQILSNQDHRKTCLACRAKGDERGYNVCAPRRSVQDDAVEIDCENHKRE